MTPPLLEQALHRRRLLLTGPENPDGDSIGACLALQRLLARLTPGIEGPEIEVVVAGRPGYRYGWLAGAAEMWGDDRLADEQGASTEPRFDGVIVLDGDCRRLLPAAAAAFARAAWTGIIDHHRSTDTSAYSAALFDPDAESTCSMIHALYEAAGVAPDRDAAAALYTGLIFDTGGFRYANTRAATHRLAEALLLAGIDHADIARRVLLERQPAALRLMGQTLAGAEFLLGGQLLIGRCTLAQMAALGAQDEDIEGVVDTLQHTRGVQLAVLIVERSGGRVKLSLRSPGAVDVARLARDLHPGGGGHARAAGTQFAADPQTLDGWLIPRLIAAVEGG